MEIIHICNPKLKNSYINVSKENVVLKTPNVSSRYIDSLLKDKELWIRKKLLELENKVYVDKVISDEKVAKKYLSSKVDYFSRKMGLKFSELKFRKMKRRWGSCNSNGVITLNTYLYNTPEKQIDYVVVHELAHLVHMNHSKEFHSLVASHIPQSLDRSYLKEFYLL